MSTILIFHGIGGDSQENWFPWLKAELEKQKHRVIVPNFPHPDTPKLDEWLTHIKKYEDSIDTDTVFVGHSLGGSFALRLLETMNHPIRATFLIASVWETQENEYAPLMTSFTEAPYDWKTIQKNGGDMHIIHSDDDAYLPLSYAEELHKNLECRMTIIPEGKHLNTEAGFKEFPALLDFIQALP